MRVLLSAALALAFACSACAQTRDVTDPSAPRALATGGPVTVEWTDPAAFTEIRSSRNRWEARRGDWVHELADHLRKEAEQRIGPGERLHVVITDIRRAGDFEPGLNPQMDHVRIMRDLYWPRITLQFSHLDASGNPIAEGEHELSDPNYLSSIPGRARDEALRYEKAMIDDWLQREFGPRR